MKEYTEEQKKVMHAWVDGAEIECSLNDDRWSLIKYPNCPQWDWKTTMYRVKPAPLGIGYFVDKATKKFELRVCTYKEYKELAVLQHYSYDLWTSLDSLGLDIKKSN